LLTVACKALHASADQHGVALSAPSALTKVKAKVAKKENNNKMMSSAPYLKSSQARERGLFLSHLLVLQPGFLLYLYPLFLW
jgi:hypothetical protein